MTAAVRFVVATTRTMHIRPFHVGDAEGVIDVWRRCDLLRPWNDPQKDIRRKVAVQPEGFLVAVDERGTVVGTIMVGYDGHRGWINYIGVSPDHQRRGIGRALMAEAERLLRAKGCPKINLQVRTSNSNVLAFYKAIGFAPDDVVSFGKRLERDDA
jgi:ribosomal protein S18 acetylase RimI-like enzyme